MSIIVHNKRHLFLAGFMGTGKSRVGAAVALRLSRVFYDIDALIVALTGRPIGVIFHTEGEPAFRHHESRALRAVVGSAGSVIALGGGTPVIKSNISILRRTGQTVLLTADWRVIWNRVKGDGSRPLLSGVTSASPASFEQFVAHAQPLLQSRWESYRAISDHVIDTSALSIAEVTDQVVVWWRSQTREALP